jgi:hypothetical protein
MRQDPAGKQTGKREKQNEENEYKKEKRKDELFFFIRMKHLRPILITHPTMIIIVFSDDSV